MKRVLLSATALTLILSVPAFAAPHDHHDDRTPAAASTPAAGGAGHGHGGHAHGAGGANPFAGGANGGATGGTHHRGGGTANTPAAGSATTNNPFAGGTMGGHHGGNTGGTAPIFGTGGHGRTGHSHNNAFDQLRRAFNAPRHFHGGNYRRPQGWYAHRWTFGEFLPSLFYSRSYWISDFEDYDLSDPPPGTVWVRYGDDALLIDEDSGEVIQVVYGIFY